MSKGETTLLFTDLSREKYWEKYIPKLFTYTHSSDFEKTIPKIIERQKALKKKCLEKKCQCDAWKCSCKKVPRTTIVIDNDSALEIKVPVIERLNIRILFVDDVETLEALCCPDSVVSTEQIRIAKQVSRYDHMFGSRV